MKHYWFSLLWLVSSAIGAQPFHPDMLVGNWVASGRFYNQAFQHEFGSVDFDLQIDKDWTLRGHVGSSSITPVKPTLEGQTIVYAATLQGAIRPGSSFAKDRLVLLLTSAEGGKISGDFHLKSNFIFDWSMRPGEFVATRKP